MEDFTQRFTGRAAVYSKYRPTYPDAVLEILREEANFDSSKIVADIGSGTGILTTLFLDNGNPVFAVEPNDEMKSFAEHSLSKFPNFVSVRGTAENTTLGDHSIDLISVGQALHWFDPEKSRKEFLRILRTSGHLCVLYNDRKNNENSGIMKDYEQVVSKYSRNRVLVQKVEDENLSKFFKEWSFEKFTLPNYQYLDFEGFLGRLCSASYMPHPEEQSYLPLKSELKNMFNKYQKDNLVTLNYETNLFLGSLKL
jgi:ubiquinone/menaquinone biosynthesis C-methylase UbiE